MNFLKTAYQNGHRDLVVFGAPKQMRLIPFSKNFKKFSHVFLRLMLGGQGMKVNPLLHSRLLDCLCNQPDYLYNADIYSAQLQECRDKSGSEYFTQYPVYVGKPLSTMSHAIQLSAIVSKIRSPCSWGFPSSLTLEKLTIPPIVSSPPSKTLRTSKYVPCQGESQVATQMMGRWSRGAKQNSRRPFK